MKFFYSIYTYILIIGNNDMHFDNVDFDADFDPNEHDKKMKELFNDEYYAGGQDEEQKPEFPEIDDELGIEPTWDKYDPITDKIDMEATPYEEPHCEDPDFNVPTIHFIYIFCQYISLIYVIQKFY